MAIAIGVVCSRSSSRPSSTRAVARTAAESQRSVLRPSSRAEPEAQRRDPARLQAQGARGQARDHQDPRGQRTGPVHVLDDLGAATLDTPGSPEARDRRHGDPARPRSGQPDDRDVHAQPRGPAVLLERRPGRDQAGRGGPAKLKEFSIRPTSSTAAGRCRRRYRRPEPGRRHLVRHRRRKRPRTAQPGDGAAGQQAGCAAAAGHVGAPGQRRVRPRR